ncbi:hypothetical protein WICPIJ_004656 [Wickerhamomyces pijperi]|uniref:Uncharacterized protein n=1 Tax=Wickerhamomyces pijperi TaxID=599730 RepID=A0A9P8TMQ0_WICPI|nr:hypothetical protein WICPIJ_004656 [Wickerhamomyces pijperi]
MLLCSLPVSESPSSSSPSLAAWNLLDSALTISFSKSLNLEASRRNLGRSPLITSLANCKASALMLSKTSSSINSSMLVLRFSWISGSSLNTTINSSWPVIGSLM